MRLISQIALITGILFIGINSFSSTVEVSGKRYVPGCSYFSVVQGEFLISYYNPDLVGTGARVYIHRGFNGFLTRNRQPIEWQDIRDDEMQQQSESHWGLKLTSVIHSRGGSYYHDALDFVMLIVYPDGSSAYDNSGTGRMSFYKATLPTDPVQCSASTIEGEDIKMTNLPVEVVVRF